MNLWTVFKIGKNNFCLDPGNNKPAIGRFHTLEQAQHICDEHNAWVILAERDFIVTKHVNGKYGVAAPVMNAESIHMDWTGYPCNDHDSPVAAILAADKWLQERQACQ